MPRGDDNYLRRVLRRSIDSLVAYIDRQDGPASVRRASARLQANYDYMVNAAEDVSAAMEEPGLSVAALRRMRNRLQTAVSVYQASMARGNSALPDRGYESDY